METLAEFFTAVSPYHQYDFPTFVSGNESSASTLVTVLVSENNHLIFDTFVCYDFIRKSGERVKSMNNSLLRNRMQKMLMIVTALGLLVLSNTVAAGYADEYRAQHPRRVKTTITQNTKGQYEGSEKYKLFDRTIDGYQLKLEFKCNSKGPDLLLLTCSTFGGRNTPAITELSCGDGKNKHVLHRFVGLHFPIRRHSVGTFLIAHVNPSELYDAIVISANDVVVINNQHKRWPEFQQALRDAERLYNERQEIWKRLNEMADNANRKVLKK